MISFSSRHQFDVHEIDQIWRFPALKLQEHISYVLLLSTGAMIRLYLDESKFTIA